MGGHLYVLLMGCHLHHHLIRQIPWRIIYMFSYSLLVYMQMRKHSLVEVAMEFWHGVYTSNTGDVETSQVTSFPPCFISLCFLWCYAVRLAYSRDGIIVQTHRCNTASLRTCFYISRAQEDTPCTLVMLHLACRVPPTNNAKYVHPTHIMYRSEKAQTCMQM